MIRTCFFVLLTIFMVSSVSGSPSSSAANPFTWSSWSNCDGGMKYRDKMQRVTQKIREITGCCGQYLDSEDLPKDCGDIFKSGQKEPGNYDIFIRGEKENKVSVACMEEGWTVIQSRGQFGNPQDYFFKGWTDYVDGFGVPGEEHWIGLQNIFDLTNSTDKYQLRVTLHSFNETSAMAIYDDFYLENQDKYNIHVGRWSGGSANDGLTYHNGMGFTTFDRDNDEHGSNCALIFKSAWWYNGCYHSNLNGINFPQRTSSSRAMRWRSFDKWYSLKSAQMAVRRMDFNL